MSISPRQLPLAIDWPDIPSFDTFVRGCNAEALEAVQGAATHNSLPLLLHGATGSGKTHLLQAAARAAHEAGRPSAYISLAEGARLTPEITEGFDAMPVLVLDECEAVCTDDRWAETLIRLIDQRRVTGNGLLLASRLAPSALPASTIPDLQSRLAACTAFRLRPLPEAACKDALQRHAGARGLTLDDQVANFMLHRLPRDLPSLLSALDQLNMASLAARHRLTIPFVQRWLLAKRDHQPPGTKTRFD